MSPLSRFGLVAPALLALACASSAGEKPAPGASSSAGSGPAPTETETPPVEVSGPRTSQCAAGESNKPGYRMLRRLSQAEYNRTLRSVFALDTSFPDIEFPGEIRQRGVYDSYSDALSVNEGILTELADSTFERAQALLAAPLKATTLVAPCVAGAEDAACADAMVRFYGLRLFRRPLSELEVADYVGLFTSGVGELMLSGSEALAGVLSALMQSPRALYIEQLGTAEGDGFRLGPYDIASILAYGLTGTAPPAELVDRVTAGALDGADGILAVARELAASAAGQTHVSRFFEAWLGYDGTEFVAKDATVYAFTPELAQAMIEEQRLLVDTTYKNGGGLAELLLAPQTYVNLPLAQHYGWPTDGLTATTFTERLRPAGQGLGVMAQGAFLTRLATSNSSSPTQRGVFALRTLSCLELGAPPPVVPEIIPPDGTITTRERYEDVHGVDGCSLCHGRIDPIGFGLENFDGVGRYRTEEVGKPIDASGTLPDFGNVAFNGPEELARSLAGRVELHQCFAAQLSSYVFGVSIADGACIPPASAYAATSGVGFQAVIDQVATAAHLTQRSH